MKDCDNETEYKNYIYGSTSNGIRLNVDHIRHHVNVANGFMTVPPADNPDLDNYMDVIHYSEQVGDRILEWMAAGEHRLTRDNVDQYFETIRDFYGSYDYGRIYD